MNLNYIKLHRIMAENTRYLSDEMADHIKKNLTSDFSNKISKTISKLKNLNAKMDVVSTTNNSISIS